MAWNPNEQTTTLEMWDAGSSALEISAALGTKTRNAVIGWLNRQGIGDKDRSVSFAMLQERRKRSKAELLALKRAVMQKVRRVPELSDEDFGKARKRSGATNRRIDMQATGRIGFGVRISSLEDRSNNSAGDGYSFLYALSELKSPAKPERGGDYIPGPDGITTLNVKRGECRWPMSMEPRKSRYVDDAPDMGDDALCGHVTAHASPYCQHHAGRAAKPNGGEA
jgi:hypothetical protein